MRFRAPAIVFLRRAQAILILAGLVPTILMTATGIIILVTGARSATIAAGVLVLAFCTSVATGIILVSVLVSRGVTEARFQQDYLSTVSHELRTPLTSIRLFIEALGTKDLAEEEKQKSLNLVHQEMERLDDLVERLLDLTRMEIGANRFVHEPVSIADVVQDALSVVAVTTLVSDFAVEVEVEDGLTVSGDHTALVRALSNLLTNAWKYTPEDDQQISLRAHALGRKFVEIVVKDNGPGIAPAEHHRIFEAFHRGSTATKTKTSGSGLGLAIVRAIVRAHKGRVEVHSEQGHGAEFRIRLRRLPT